MGTAGIPPYVEWHQWFIPAAVTGKTGITGSFQLLLISLLSKSPKTAGPNRGEGPNRIEPWPSRARLRGGLQRNPGAGRGDSVPSDVQRCLPIHSMGPMPPQTGQNTGTPTPMYVGIYGSPRSRSRFLGNGWVNRRLRRCDVRGDVEAARNRNC